MTNYESCFRIGGAGSVILALLLSGCAGNGASPGSAGAGQGFAPATAGDNAAPANVAQTNGVDEDSSDAVTPDQFRRHHHHGACAPVTNTQNFNGTAINKGDYIWFSSVMSFPGNQGGLKVQMTDSTIRFSDGSRNFKIKGPAMTAVLGSSKVRLKFDNDKRKGSQWTLRAPVNTAGNDYLNGIAYRVTRALPGGIQNVTWSGKFFSKSGVQQMHWQWGAAVYTRFSGKYQRLGVKALDDNHYPPYNSDHAGTPERYKGFVTGGATGGGGGNYTGGLGPTINVTPCK